MLQSQTSYGSTIWIITSSFKLISYIHEERVNTWRDQRIQQLPHIYNTSIKPKIQSKTSYRSTIWIITSSCKLISHIYKKGKHTKKSRNSTTTTHTQQHLCFNPKQVRYLLYESSLLHLSSFHIYIKIKKIDL